MAESTPQNWAETELKGAQFRDQRLNQRMIEMADAFSKNPQSPINKANQDAASTKAAYRFFSNPKVTPEKILHPHQVQTLERIQAHSVVLAIQDTSSLNYHAHPKTQGLGEISKTGKTSVQGLFMHSVFCVSTEGIPLGFLDQRIWARPKDEQPSGKKKARVKTIEEKESIRWIESLRQTAEMASKISSRIVTVCDREADMFEFFLESKELNQDVVVRCFRDREVNEEEAPIWDFANSLPVAGKMKVEIVGTQKRKARTARVQVRYAPIEMNPPAGSLLIDVLPMYVVHVKEVYTPAGEEPLEWLLYTTVAVNSFEDAQERVSWYKLRWMIEVFHKILKSGFQIEDCRLEEGVRLMRYLTLMSVVAWRILWMLYTQRSNPDGAATLVFSESEWKVLYGITHKTNKIPNKVGSLRDAIHWVARLGGFLDRKGDGEPGMITLWRGWNRLMDMMISYEIFSSE
jgi:hypothetical protein